MTTPARPSRASAPPECAQCGADIPPKARACPSCGADERTGWREASSYDGIDLPDEAFEDDDGLPDGEASTFSGGSRGRKKSMPRRAGLAWHWWVTGVLLVLVLVAGALALN